MPRGISKKRTAMRNAILSGMYSRKTVAALFGVSHGRVGQVARFAGAPAIRTPGYAKHGSQYKYNSGCRCDLCVQAIQDSIAKLRAIYPTHSR